VLLCDPQTTPYPIRSLILNLPRPIIEFTAQSLKVKKERKCKDQIAVTSNQALVVLIKNGLVTSPFLEDNVNLIHTIHLTPHKF
ncbi:14344_t:CDS:2, partial [Acaulospora colombiana]